MAVNAMKDGKCGSLGTEEQQDRLAECARWMCLVGSAGWRLPAYGGSAQHLALSVDSATAAGNGRGVQTDRHSVPKGKLHRRTLSVFCFSILPPPSLVRLLVLPVCDISLKYRKY
jgi:hypothetical protein